MNDTTLCVECQHFDNFSCKAPGNLYISRVDGKKRGKQTPEFLRDDKGKCGPQAAWFLKKLEAA